jgi:hypothetical protein
LILSGFYFHFCGNPRSIPIPVDLPLGDVGVQSVGVQQVDRVLAVLVHDECEGHIIITIITLIIIIIIITIITIIMLYSLLT